MLYFPANLRLTAHLLYLLLVGASVGLAWRYPFLFEIPLLVASAVPG